MAFVMAMFVAVPAAGAMATAFDRRWGRRFWLPAAIAGLSVMSVTITLLAGQWTTLSEMGLFRPAATVFLVWLGLIALGLRRGARPLPPSTSVDVRPRPAGSHKSWDLPRAQRGPSRRVPNTTPNHVVELVDAAVLEWRITR